MIDLDNTLADRDQAVRSWIAEFCAEHGLTASDADWIHQLDNDGYSSRRHVFETLHEHFGLGTDVEALLNRYQQRIVELIEPSIGAIDCLVDLRTCGHVIAIVTNGSSKQQHGKIKGLGFAPLVDAVCVSGDLDIKKPDPRIFRHAAALAGESLGGAWMVGDSAHHDVLGAQQLGIATAWLHRGHQWDSSLPEPDLVLDSLQEFVVSLQAR